jgi:hypothetical protein
VELRGGGEDQRDGSDLARGETSLLKWSNRLLDDDGYTSEKCHMFTRLPGERAAGQMIHLQL